MMEKNSPQNMQKTVRFFEKQLCASADGIVITDPAKNIIFVNDTFCKFFSRTKQDVIETNIFVWLAKLGPNAKDSWKGMEIQIKEHGIAKDVEFMMKYGEEMRYFSVNSSLIKNNGIEYAGLIISNWHDDTERKRAEEALRENKDYYGALFSQVSDAVYIIEQETGRVLDVNEAACRIYGYTREEWVKMKNTDVSAEPNETIKATKEPPNIIPVRYHRKKDGTVFPLEMNLNTFNLHGRKTILVTARDITERKWAENQIQASHKEKEILLKEIHHRVKNNMQLISSLLGLQSMSSQDKKFAEIFRDSQNRINSISLIHDKLYHSKDLATIELNDYIRDLTNRLSMSRGIAGRIELILNIENVSLGIDHAIPCGLIINELITNCLKHAFPGDRNGEIKVSAHRDDENMIELIFSDNGVGIPSNIDFRNTQSLGLHLVTILVQDQLNGKIDLDRTRGTEYKIMFKG